MHRSSEDSPLGSAENLISSTSALHVAAYFALTDTAEILLQEAAMQEKFVRSI